MRLRTRITPLSLAQDFNARCATTTQPRLTRLTPSCHFRVEHYFNDALCDYQTTNYTLPRLSPPSPLRRTLTTRCANTTAATASTRPPARRDQSRRQRRRRCARLRRPTHFPYTLPPYTRIHIHSHLVTRPFRGKRCGGARCRASLHPATPLPPVRAARACASSPRIRFRSALRNRSDVTFIGEADLFSTELWQAVPRRSIAAIHFAPPPSRHTPPPGLLGHALRTRGVDAFIAGHTPRRIDALWAAESTPYRP